MPSTDSRRLLKYICPSCPRKDCPFSLVEQCAIKHKDLITEQHKKSQDSQTLNTKTVQQCKL